MTQGDLAKLLLVNRRTVGTWERGEATPNVTQSRSLAKALSDPKLELKR